MKKSQTNKKIKIDEKTKQKIKKTVLRVLIITVTVLVLVVTALYSVMFVLVKGPSAEARRLFVLSVKETSAIGFLANLYLTDEEIAEILNTNANTEETETIIETNTELIKITDVDKRTEVSGEDTSHESEDDEKSNDYELVDVGTGTYEAFLLKITDPKRLFVGVPDSYGEESEGLTIYEMIKKFGASGGINAGGFFDPDGTGNGGIPDGLVISGGNMLWGNPDTKYSISGFDGNGILHVGTLTGAKALEIGITEAVSFGPALIMNGIPLNADRALGGGLNPRTAIGQTADGTVLLLVTEGRQLSSLGATYDDLVRIMLEHGAVNASNLDGGTSSALVFNGETVASSCYYRTPRELSTAFLIK